MTDDCPKTHFSICMRPPFCILVDVYSSNNEFAISEDAHRNVHTHNIRPLPNILCRTLRIGEPRARGRVFGSVECLHMTLMN